MDKFLQVKSNSSAIIQNNTLTENNFLSIVFDIESNSIIQLKNAIFTKNKLMGPLLLLGLSSSAIIHNKTMTENKDSYFMSFSVPVYYIFESSTIQLNHVTFIRNKMMSLLSIYSNSSAIIQNNTLTENDFSWSVFYSRKNSTVQLNHVTFIHNKMNCLLWIDSNSSAIIQNNTLTENVMESIL